ncbi:MAG: hypothetical protein Q9162_002478 [Coniocarpon cinnabarinum]
MFLPPFRANAPEAPSNTEAAIAAAQQALNGAFTPDSTSDIDTALVLDLKNQGLVTRSTAPTSLSPASATPLPTKTFEVNANASSEQSVAASHPSSQAQSRPSTYFPTFSASTQEILRRHGHNPHISQDSPEYQAARRQVLESMVTALPASSPHANSDFSSLKRGRGRGRPPKSSRLGIDGGVGRTADTVGIETAQFVESSIRGRNRGGRPRGSGRARGRGGGRKRKRDESEEDRGGGGSSSGSDDEPVTPQAPTITKSGRSIQKPTAYTPLLSHTSPSSQRAPHSASTAMQYSAPGRGRGGRKLGAQRNTQLALCAKCLRGHSPESNVIVFCDGCNTPWHQWCHSPKIGKEVIEVTDAAWFCSRCSAEKEEERWPLEGRVSGAGWSSEAREEYIEACGAEMLRSLLKKVLSTYPEAPIFPPMDTTKRGLDTVEGTATSSALTPLSGMTPAPSSALAPVKDAAHLAHESREPHKKARRPSAKPQVGEEADDPYPDITLAAATNDPPSTYPRPGQGPIPLSSTTKDGDMRWLVDDEGFSVFSHFYDGATERIGVGGRTGDAQCNGANTDVRINGGSEETKVPAADATVSAAVSEGLVNVAGTGTRGVKGSWIHKKEG